MSGPPDISLLARLLRVAEAAPSGDDALRDRARGEGLRLRRVRLRQRAWWRRDNGPLLVTLRDGNGRALVLWPDGDGGADAWDPAGGRGVPLDGALAARLAEDAHAPFRRFGAGPLSPAAWGRFARAGAGRERAVEWAAGFGLGLTAALPGAALLTLGPMVAAGDRSGILGVLAALLAAALGGALFDHARRIAAARAAAMTDLGLHGGLWDRLFDLPLRLLRDTPPLTLAERLHDGIAAMQQAEAARASVRRAVPQLVPALAVMGWAAPLPALAVSLLLLAGAATQAALLRRADAARRGGETATPELRRRIDRAVQALPQLRLLGAAPWAAEDARDGLAAAATVRRRAADRLANADAVGHALSLGAPLLGAGLALGQGGGVATAGALALAAMPACRAARRLADAFGRLPLAVRLEPLRPLLEAAPEVPSGAPAPGRIETLALRNVGFTHPGAPSPCLRGVGLALARGEILAVAGPSGSGKSTLLALALGLVRPDSGEVLVNGRDLAGLDAAAYRARIGAVMQDEEIGVATIRSVILGMAPLPAERAWEAARLARLDADIAAMPMGIQTLVAEGSFPAGLVQRLLIARALARDPDLLVLDEATAALDEDIQAALFADLRRLGIAVLVASHRPSTLALADHVLHLSPPR
ncbi:ABC-type bacteriocin/lantibiotic exporter with double-glycine peptidase domain [Azospirillum agricola]|uniref:ATP-binding cassette domain-containing protein n=1 Tax=Azospirillum agricola TaxID=1720247 RepID=UPI001AE8395E|nr:ATP-binding cassette domain-containing protein [Azospirillum agricola]MBP2230006.1 ABC-type bacteriocin/lantibiotic exporter with double-glycine peptidase domain [Azospirillum agricola]